MSTKNKPTHVTYAVDILILTKENRNDAEAIKKVIGDMLEMTTLKLNSEKSKIFFRCREDVLAIIGIRQDKLLTTYLGIPPSSVNLKD